MSNHVTILLADDHPIVRKGLRETIEEEGSMRVIAEVSNGREAIEAIEQTRPRIAVLDIDMPLVNGFGVARAIREKNLSTEIVFVTMHRDEDLFNEAIDVGAKGFVLKDSALSDIVECLKTVASANHYASHSLTSFLVNRSRRAAGLTDSRPTIARLTPTERRVMQLIADGKTSREIGELMFISPRTVEKHRANICEKLDLRGSHSLFKFALQHKSELL